MFHVGLNPYGLTYTLGLQGMGTARVNPRGTGLQGFLATARRVGARCAELDWRWLTGMDDDVLRRLGDACRADGMTVILSAWLMQRAGETLDTPLRVASALGATLLRLHLTPVLEGGRARAGTAWSSMAAHARQTILAEAPKLKDAGLAMGLENHQDFGSEELLAIAGAAGDHVGIVMDTGNPFAVGEDPVAFATRTAARIKHVHLKDYRAQFTNEGVRLVRCPIGDGCVPLTDIAAVLQARGVSVTASLEPAALEARHVRFFTNAWWDGYGPRDAREFGQALARLRERRLDDDADYRTPWERRAPVADLVAYETADLERSVRNMRSLGWM
ncbi:MAG: sugar phosphate isomerase/epimerase family protein [Acidobacteriota bacterium]